MKKSIFTTTCLTVLLTASLSSVKAQYYYQQPKKDNTAEVVGAILGVIAVVAVADGVEKGNITKKEVKQMGKDILTFAEALQSIAEANKPKTKPQPTPAKASTDQIRQHNEALQAQILVRQFEIQQSINYYDALGKKWKADSFQQ